jgi:hypothetical protein
MGFGIVSKSQQYAAILCNLDNTKDLVIISVGKC